MSDFADKPNDERWRNHKRCTFMTQDEAAIVFECVRRSRVGHWVDIGAHSGWTALHILEGGAESVSSVDPELGTTDFLERFMENTRSVDVDAINRANYKSMEFFSLAKEYGTSVRIPGAVIDGCHDAPCPLEDAQNCASRCFDTACLIFHDAYGEPIQAGARWLIEQGWKCKVYFTPNGMFVCYRGDFTPPEHVPDPQVNWAHVARTRLKGFPIK